MSFRGVNTRGIPYRTRRALDRISEYLERPLDEIQPTGESPSIPRTVLRDISRVQHIVSGVVGTVTHLEAPPRDTLLVMRFKATPTLTGGGNLSLRGPFTPLSTGDALVFVSDGQRLYEIARSGGTPAPLNCPTNVYQNDASCNPVLAIYPSTSTISPIWSAWVGTGTDYVTQRLSLLPYVDPITETPVYNNGGENNYWKGLYAHAIFCRRILAEAATNTLTSAVYPRFTGIAGFTVYRMNPTLTTHTIQTIAKPVATYPSPFFDLINVATSPRSIIFKDQIDGLGNADERIITGLNGDFTLNRYGIVRLWYDIDSLRWRCLK